METLVSCEWLNAHLDEPDLVVLDCTVAFELGEGGKIHFKSGESDWAEAHIPDSRFADIIGALSDPESEHDFTLCDAAQFGAEMGRLGIGNETRVVVYDQNFGMWATRVWWMLRAFGHEQAAVLDGGFTSWTRADLPVSDSPPEIRPATFKASLSPGWFVGKEDVRASLEDRSSDLIDALMSHMYTGETQPYSRAGHIPGAVNIPAVAIVDPDTMRFLPEEQLREAFGQILESDKPRVTAYCGGGIAATLDAFVLRRLGKENISVYDGSLSEWSADASCPMVAGEAP